MKRKHYSGNWSKVTLEISTRPSHITRNGLKQEKFNCYQCNFIFARIKLVLYVAVPRKQLNQDFSTNMLLKIYLCIILMLTMAPNIPQCTLKMLVIQPGPPFHFNEVEMVKKRDWASKKVVRSWLKFSLKLRILTQFTSVYI